MNFSVLKKTLLRIYKSYVKKHYIKLIFALFLSFCVAGGTAAIAWLLDPAVKKVFIEQDNTMMILIPIAIVLAFSVKGLSLFFARTIMIKISNEIVKTLQVQLSSCILKSDINTIESKHSGKYIAHFFYDVGQVSQLVSSGVLNLMKDPLTLIVLVSLMFYQNWKLASFAIIMMPLSALVAKSLGKRMGKVTTESTQISAKLSTFLSEMIKGSRMIKMYQQEKFEFDRSNSILNALMNKEIKVANVLIRATPIMEILTGFVIAGFIYYTAIMIGRGEIEINQFHQDGFVVARNVIQGKELLALQEAASRITSEGIAAKDETNRLYYDQSDGSRTYFRSERMWDRDPIFQAVTVNPVLLTHYGQLIGHPFMPIVDSFVCKLPFGNVPVRWHQDPPFGAPTWPNT